MVWIASHDTLEDHPKLEKLCELTGVELEVCYFRLHCLWKKALLYRPDGDMGQVSDAQIARWARWPAKDATAFVKALCDCGKPTHESGFMDADRKLHQFDEYSAPWLKYLARLEYDRNRKRNGKSPEVPTEFPVESRAEVQPEIVGKVVQNSTKSSVQTLHNNTLQTKQTEQTGAVGAVLTAAQTAAPGSEIRDEQKEPAEQKQPLRTALPGAEVRHANGVEATPTEKPRSDLRLDDGIRGAVRSDSQPAVRSNASRRADVETGNAKSAAINREWDVFGYALRRGAYISEEQSRRMVAWGKHKNPHAIRIPFMQLMLARLLEGIEKQKAGELRNDDPVGYAIGWTINPDSATRRRPAEHATMKQAVEILNMADVALAKNGSGHREWMDSLEAEISAMAKGMKAGVPK